LSVTLVLDRELDISRGDLIVPAERLATVTRSIQAALVWMDERPLEQDRRYLLKHTSHTVPAVVTSIDYRTDIATLRHEAAETLQMNNIGVVSIRLLRPIAVDVYSENRGTGAFVLIDAESNHTVAAGMITAAVEPSGESGKAMADGPVTAEERAERWGHVGGVLELTGSIGLIDSIERALFEEGLFVVPIEAHASWIAVDADGMAGITEWARKSGVVALLAHESGTGTSLAKVGAHQVFFEKQEPSEAVLAVFDLLSRSGILAASRKAEQR
jgi:sulfate adenylyltransferase subunit 1